MARLKNSEWAVMIVQRTLEIEQGKRKLFLSELEKLQVLDNSRDLKHTLLIIRNVLKQCEEPKADLRILGKAKSGLAKINDRENRAEKCMWFVISNYQPGDRPGIVKILLKPMIKFCKRIIKKGKKH